MIDNKQGNVLFILVDDDEISNMISMKVIQNTWSEVETVEFTNPLAALEFIQNDLTRKAPYQNVLLLLNITMPVMSGWELLDRFQTLSSEIKSRIDVYMLSASLDYRDKDKSRLNQYVVEFLPKPLTAEMVLFIKKKSKN